MEVSLTQSKVRYIHNLTSVMQVFAPSNSSTAAAVTFITFVQDLKKKSKTTMADENDPQGASPRSLKPLRLVRSETTKERAALRAREVLPDVVVRPPSQHSTYGY